MKANKAVVTAFIDALNARDFEALAELVAPDVRRHSRATPGVDVRSWDDFRAFLEADFAVFPDARQEVRLILGEGAHVAVLVTLTGTQEGAFGPFPATGRRVTTDFLAILRLADARIAEMWVEWDNLAILQQLGLAPAE